MLLDLTDDCHVLLVVRRVGDVDRQKRVRVDRRLADDVAENGEVEVEGPPSEAAHVPAAEAQGMSCFQVALVEHADPLLEDGDALADGYALLRNTFAFSAVPARRTGWSTLSGLFRHSRIQSLLLGILPMQVLVGARLRLLNLPSSSAV